MVNISISSNKNNKKILDDLFTACYDVDIKRVKNLIIHCRDINETNYGDETLLMCAIVCVAEFDYNDYYDYKTKLNIIKYLIKNGANMHYVNKYGDSAFIYSLKYGNINIIKYFIKSGVDINQIYKTCEYISNYDNLETLNYLYKIGIDLNYLDQFGHNLLYNALLNNEYDIIKFIIKHGIINGINEVMFDNISRLIENIDIIKYLEKYGIIFDYKKILKKHSIKPYLIEFYNHSKKNINKRFNTIRYNVLFENEFENILFHEDINTIYDYINEMN